MKNNFCAFLLAFLCLPIIYGQTANDDWTFHHQPDDGWFGAIVKDNLGNIIVGGGGANSHFRVYDGSTWTLYKPEDFNVSYSFYGRNMAIGPDNILWIAQGNSDGLTSWDGTNLQNYNTSNSNIISNSVFGVGVSPDNTLWHTRLQSFDGNDWDLFSNTCTSGSKRQVSFSSAGDTWISGGVTLGIESGIIYQPCVYQISGDTVVSFHFETDDNVPKLDGGSGYHLLSELADGSLLLFGRTAIGIEVKKFNGTGWDDFDLFESNEVENSGYYGIYRAENDAVWLCGPKGQITSQIVKYCDGNWTVYDLPMSEGFPSSLYDILVDGDELWAVGNVGICQVTLPEENCGIIDNLNTPVKEKLCESVTYDNGQLTLHSCSDQTFPLQYILVNTMGQIVKSGNFYSRAEEVGLMESGIYILQLKNKQGNFSSVKMLVK